MPVIPGASAFVYFKAHHEQSGLVAGSPGSRLIPALQLEQLMQNLEAEDFKGCCFWADLSTF